MTSILSRTAGVAFAALLTLPGAAFAAETQSSTAISGMAAVAAVQAPSPNTKYCIVNREVTGSLFASKVCHTRADWLARGFDPLAPNK